MPELEPIDDQSANLWTENLPKKELQRWTLDTSRLEEKTFEAKYPDTSWGLHDRYTYFLTNILGNPSVSAHHAYTTFLYNEDAFPPVPYRSPQPIERYQSFFEHHDSSIFDLAHTTQQTIVDIVQSMELPADTKESMISYLHATDVQFTVNSEIGSEAHRRENRIDIDLNQVLHAAMKLSRATTQPMSDDLLRTMLVQTIAHEFGHQVDGMYAVQDKTTHTLHYASSTVERDETIPVTFADDEAHIPIWSERFSMYFEREAVARMGLSTEAIEDFTRLYVSEYMTVVRTVPLQKLVAFINELDIPDIDLFDFEELTPSASGEDPDPMISPRTMIKKSVMFFLSGHPIGQAYPFTEQQVQQAILTQSTQQGL